MVKEKVHLLVVDDDPDAGDTLNHYLSARGYEVNVANSGKEALVILDNQKIDVVLLDIMLPDVNGDIIAKTIKDKQPDVKIIIVTGYPDSADLVSRLVTVDGCCFKPSGIEDIYNKLRELQTH